MYLKSIKREIELFTGADILYINIYEFCLFPENGKQTILHRNKNPIEKLWKETKSVPLTQIHNHSLSWLGTGTSMKKYVVSTSFMDLSLPS